MPSCRKATTRTWAWWTEAARPWRIAGALALVAGGAWMAVGPAADDPAPRPDQVAGFMRVKLAHSQDVLEGLAVADFDLIDRGAQRLWLVSEDASWQVLQTPQYARHSAEFRQSCEGLRKAARERNLDGAALAWMEVTMRCIQCHKYVRDQERPAP